MKGERLIVEIERIVLDRLDVTPERGERIRRIVEARVQERLEKEPSYEQLAAAATRIPVIPAIDDAASLSDEDIADIVADATIEALRRHAVASEEAP